MKENLPHPACHSCIIGIVGSYVIYVNHIVINVTYRTRPYSQVTTMTAFWMRNHRPYPVKKWKKMTCLTLYFLVPTQSYLTSSGHSRTVANRSQKGLTQDSDDGLSPLFLLL